MLEQGGLKIVDHGTAPRFYVSGLGRITPMGPVALFSFYVVRPETEEEAGAHVIEVELFAPVEAVGPAFELAIATLGARCMVGLAGQAIGHVVNKAASRWTM